MFWTNYINFFDNLKPVGQFTPYAIIGDPPSGCEIPPRTRAQYGAGYWDIVDHYGGSWYSICASDWGVQLQMMADQMAGQSAYGLQEEDPIEDTIVVRVNGQIMSEWEYDANTNSVRFASGSIPEPGQTVEIEYAVWGC